MRLDIAVYTLLLLAGLGTAYWAATPVDEAASEKVAVVSFEPKRITSLTFESDGGAEGAVKSVATRRNPKQFWVDYTRTEPVKTPAAADPKDPKAGEQAPPPPPESVNDHFLAGEKLDDLLTALSPLSAARDLGKVDDAQLEEFGLKDSKAKFSIATDDGKTYTLALGKRSYGTRNRFVREVSEGSAGRVLLVDDAGIEDLERANVRLYERRLVGIPFEEVSKVEIAADGKVKRLAHNQRDKDGELVWTDDEEKAQPKPSYASWMDKVEKLRLAAFASEAEVQKLASVTPFLTIVFEKEGKPVEKMEFRKADNGGKMEYFVTTDFLQTAGKMSVGRVEPLEKDIATILGSST